MFEREKERERGGREREEGQTETDTEAGNNRTARDASFLARSAFDSH